MAQIEEYESLLRGISPQPLCDGCSAQKLGFSQRQTANQFSRALATSSNFHRRKDLCYACKDLKLVTSMISIKHKKPKSFPLNEKKGASKPFAEHSQLKYLTAIGCERIGSWEQSGGEVKLNLQTMQSAMPALYVFVSNGQVLYVGKTTQLLPKRLYFYAKPDPSQSTNIRINKLLKELLSQGGGVDIFALGNQPISKIGIFTVNIPAALEDNIIKQLKPIWNIRK